MNDKDIIKLYNDGHSVDYITTMYYKYLNRNNKPVVINGITLYPVKIYNKRETRLHVVQVIYDNILHKYKDYTKTIA